MAAGSWETTRNEGREGETMRKTRVGGKKMGVKFERRAGGGVREVRTSGRGGVGTGRV